MPDEHLRINNVVKGPAPETGVFDLIDDGVSFAEVAESSERVCKRGPARDLADGILFRAILRNSQTDSFLCATPIADVDLSPRNVIQQQDRELFPVRNLPNRELDRSRRAVLVTGGSLTAGEVAQGTDSLAWFFEGLCEVDRLRRIQIPRMDGIDVISDPQFQLFIVDMSLRFRCGGKIVQMKRDSR